MSSLVVALTHQKNQFTEALSVKVSMLLLGCFQALDLMQLWLWPILQCKEICMLNFERVSLTFGPQGELEGPPVIVPASKVCLCLHVFTFNAKHCYKSTLTHKSSKWASKVALQENIVFPDEHIGLFSSPCKIACSDFPFLLFHFFFHCCGTACKLKIISGAMKAIMTRCKSTEGWIHLFLEYLSFCLVCVEISLGQWVLFHHIICFQYVYLIDSFHHFC